MNGSANGNGHHKSFEEDNIEKEKYYVVETSGMYPGHVHSPEVKGCTIALTYINYVILILLGHMRDFIGRFTQRSRYMKRYPTQGYAPLLKSWENFYTRRLYHRIQDCWNRPIRSNPGAHISVIERRSEDGNKTLICTDGTLSLLNLGSYNYLGFADDWQETCKKDVVSVLENLPIACASNRLDYGTTTIHKQLEELVAEFVGKEDAVVFNMGYATNSSGIPSLVCRGTLLVSDSLNHMSIVSGCRASGAHIRVFKHNDANDLEQVLKEAIVMGVPRTHRPWKKIIVMVEGIYSMEGEVVDLKAIVKVAKKYKAYVYLDEAHSIGALGKTGRGACEYCGVHPSEVDVLMGTFTKSFGGMGGYIAGSKELCDHLRQQCPAFVHHSALSPVVAKQVYTALRVILGLDGTNTGATKLETLRNNANYVRNRLQQMGLHVYGDYNSPVIPVMLYLPGKVAAFSRECLKRGLAVVVVGFPATSLLMARARICISAGHSKEDLEKAVVVLAEVADVCALHYSRSGWGF